MTLFPFLKRKQPTTAVQVRNFSTAPAQFHGTQLDLSGKWYAPLLSPNKAIQFEYARVKGMARHVSTNDVYGARYLDLVAINVVGPQGVQYQPKVINPTDGSQNTVVNAELERGWNEWCRSSSIEGLPFRDLEQLAIRTVACDGELFVRFVVGPKTNRFGFALCFYDSDLLDVNYNFGAASAGANAIVQGIELDAKGRRVAYHFWNRHPDDPIGVPLVRQRIPADEIIHLYKPQRTGQARGMSWLRPGLEYHARLHRYIDAVLQSAEVGALPLGAIETPINQPDVEPVKRFAKDVLEFQAGEIFQLQPGQKLSSWQSGQPNNVFDKFVASILHGLSAAYNVSYSGLASDNTAENYSGGRISLLTERDHWRNVQSWFARSFHEKVFRLWLTCALEMKALNLPTKDPDDYAAFSFRTRGWKWADPLKDSKGNESAIANSLSSKSQICAEQGMDFEEVAGERYEEMKIEAKYRKQLSDEGLLQYLEVPTAPPKETDSDATQESTSGTKPDLGTE